MSRKKLSEDLTLDLITHFSVIEVAKQVLYGEVGRVSPLDECLD